MELVGLYRPHLLEQHRATMKLVILHHHLNRGGVTQVIVNHLRALNEVEDERGACRVAVIFGGRQEDWPVDLPSQLPGVELSLHVVPEIDYDSDQSVESRPDHLARQLAMAMEQAGFIPDDTVLHVHNHSLGKNVSLPGALGRLARDGWALLLHIHDFAEDFRPDSYRRLLQTVGGGDPDRLCAVLYPQAANVHYAVLNGRDLQVLRSAGVPLSRLHALPNPVAEFGDLQPQSKARAKLQRHFPAIANGLYILYPVRAIRRKNLGEALLWAAAANGVAHIGVTKPPLNPVEHPSYRCWRELTAELSLPVVFEVGNAPGTTFPDNVAAADAFITTSVAEGFGMVFLETWLADRPLVGRNLPEITADYVDAGVNLNGLYERLAVPSEWIDWDAFRQAMQNAYQKVVADFGQPRPNDRTLRQQIDSLIEDGSVDFACLATSLQERVIRSVANDEHARETLLSLNPQLAGSLATGGEVDHGLVADNAQAVRANFSTKAAGRRLRQLYDAVLASPKDESLTPLDNGQQILSAFLGLRRLQPVRIET